jgi:hypothetical protein
MATSHLRTLLLAACCGAVWGCAPLQRSGSVVSSLDRKITTACGGVDDVAVQQASYDVPAEEADDVADAEPLPEPPTTGAPTSRAAVAAATPANEHPTADAAAVTPTDPACNDVCCGDGCDGSCDSCRSCCLLAAADRCGRCGFCQHCRKMFTRPEPGPPPIRYRPALPPKFLPVPTQPTLAPARPDAPEAWRGDVEVGFRPQLTFPAGD